LAFAADGKSLISHGRDGIRFWDTATGEEILRFPEQSNAQSMALSPDGKLLAIRRITNRNGRDNSKEKGFAIREFATGRLLRQFGDWLSPWTIVFSPDSNILAAHHNSLDIELWDPASGRRLQTLKGHERVVFSIAFSGDSKTLVSGGYDNTIRIWDIATGKELRQIKLPNSIGEIALSPDGKLLASVELVPHVNDVFGGNTVLYHDNHVRLWDAATGKELRQLTMPAKKEYRKVTDGFHHLRFAPDGKMLLTSGADGKLRVWDTATGKELRQISVIGDGLGAFALSPDGKSVAIVDGSHCIRLLDFASGKDLVPSLGHRDRVSSICMLPDNQTIATTSQDGTLRFWEPATGRQLSQRTVSVNFTEFTGLRPDGRTYVTVGPDEVCRINDLASGKELAVLHGHESLFPFALSLDGKTLASVDANKEVRLLDPVTGAVRHTLTKVNSHVVGMTFTKDGCTLVVWDADFIVTFWDTVTGKLQRRFTATESGITAPFRRGKGILLYSAALSPDGKMMAFGIQVIASKEHIIPVIETTRGKVIRRINTAEDGGYQMAFSPDSKSLAWGGPLSTIVYLGEIASGRVRQRFEGHKGQTNSLVFSADGKMLLSGSVDTTALVWDLTGRLTLGKKYGPALSADDLESHWKTLATEDAEAAFRTIQVLASDPANSVPFLGMRLSAVALADEKRSQKWIADLDSDQFAVREKATSELEKLGPAALDAMRKAIEENPALETRRRLEPLIEKLEREEWPTSGEQLRTCRALEVLERAGTPEAKEVLTTLANGAPGARQTLEAKAALQRLIQRRGS
jgi:WD40 repeat protein